ncbi:MAG: hypothetical protein H7X95_00505 [Deltaproteobacteria bacterium]|nr:hypothetical protein [Deltaproteobacteria bacterium]
MRSVMVMGSPQLGHEFPGPMRRQGRWQSGDHCSPGEALSAVSAFVDGVFTDAATALGGLGRLDRWAGSTPVGCLSAAVAAVALVGAPGQRFATERAAGIIGAIR